MLRVIILIVIVTNLGCDKKRDLGVSKNNSDDSSSITDSQAVVDKNSMTEDSTGEIYPIQLAPSMRGMGVVSIQFPKTGSTTILDSTNDVFIALNFGAREISLKDKAYSFSEASNQNLYQAHDFYPRMTSLEYEILLLDCIGKSEQFYEVVLNQQKGTTGRISASDSNALLLTWEELLLKSYISFDPKSNPLRPNPSDQSNIIYPYNDYFFKVVEVKGDWIKVKCNSDCKECEKGDLTGWIKWKEGDNFLIQIGLIC